MLNYATISYFSQYAEFVTQVAPVNNFCDVAINTQPISQIDLTNPITLQIYFADFVNVLKLRAVNLSDTNFNVVIPAAIRLMLNQWLTANGFATANVTSTYAQVITAMRNKLKP
jgi:hypothetical protein